MATKQTFTAGQVLTATQLLTLQDYVGVVQVKSTIKTDTFTMSSATFADVTGLTVSITPTSATNKIFVLATCSVGNDLNTVNNIRLMRDSTAIGIGATAGDRISVSQSAFNTFAGGIMTSTASVLDSPATTNAVVYKVQMAAQSATNVYLNRSDSDGDLSTRQRGVSTITVFEVTP